MKNVHLAFAVVSIILSSITNVGATVASMESKILKTLHTDGVFGNCMIRLVDSVTSKTNLNCPDTGWVSFSCSGDFLSKEVAYKMFESAEKAFDTARFVEVFIDDTKKHNGFCTVRRIDVFKYR